MSDSDSQGTLEVLFRELEVLLGPLGSGLAPGKAQGFLESLGLPVTAAQAQAIAGPLGALADGISHLVALGNDLEQAITGGDIPTIVGKSAAALAKVGQVIGGFNSLAAAVGGLGLPAVTPAVLAALPARLFDHLLAAYLGRNGGLLELLEFAGILEREDHNAGSSDPNAPFFTIDTFHLDKIAGWLQSPAGQLKALYGWGNAGFDGKQLLTVIDRLAGTLGLPALLDVSGPVATLDLLAFELKPNTTVNPPGLSIVLKESLGSATTETSAGNWTVTLSVAFGALAGAEIILQPNGAVTLKPPDATTISGKATLAFTNNHQPPATPLLLLGVAGGSRVEVEQVSVTAETDLKWSGGAAQGSFSLGGKLAGGKATIDAGEGDGFLQKILSGVKAESTFDLGFVYSSAEGFHFDGSGALEIQLASHISLGPVDLDALTLSVGIAGGEFPVAVSVDLKASFGPLTAVVEGIGLSLPVKLADHNSGNLGPIDIRPAFKPPKGAGLSVDAGPVSGGGYLSFDADRGEYSGVLQLDICDLVTVTAIGLVTTRMPDGSKGFSLLIILTAEFGSGIQLGLGFTLLAVGGLLGLNRTMLLQPLADGIRTGAVDSIMFPHDVVANATRIVSDLRTIFPPEEGRFLIGPMAKLGWGTPTLVSLSLGIIIEIPGDVAILGILRVALPADSVAILVLQVNFLGALEFAKKRVWFFASLFDSHILFLTIEGEMGLLAAFGDDANFVLSVGGFHPRFNPPPLPFPSPRRVEIDLINTAVSRVRVEGYFAVTTNSVQFGARADLFFGFSAINVQGEIGFDALFQFSPFYFIIQVSASFSLNVFGAGLFSVDVDMSLEGPTPWRARGTGSIHILFFSVSADFDVTWGDKRDTTLPPIAVLPLLAGELGKQESWTALPPAGSNLLVSLRQLPPAEAALVLHPVGVLRVSQRAVPLGLTLDTVGNQKPSDVNRLALTVSGGGLAKVDDAIEQFAPAQFQSMSDADKLSRPAYGPEPGGIELSAAGTQTRSSRAVKRVVRYDEIILDVAAQRTRFKRFNVALFRFFLGGASVSRSALSQSRKGQLQPFAARVDVRPEGFTVASQATNRAYAADSVSFQSEASAREYLARKASDDPGLAATLHVIPAHERAA